MTERANSLRENALQTQDTTCFCAIHLRREAALVEIREGTTAFLYRILLPRSDTNFTSSRRDGDTKTSCHHRCHLTEGSVVVACSSQKSWKWVALESGFHVTITRISRSNSSGVSISRRNRRHGILEISKSKRVETFLYVISPSRSLLFCCLKRTDP